MSRFIFNVFLVAGLGYSTAALAQTHDAVNAMPVPSTHATLMGGHIAKPQTGMNQHMVYSSDTLNTSNLTDQAMVVAPSQEFLNSVGR